MKYFDRYVAGLDELLRSALTLRPGQLHAIDEDLRMNLDGAPAAFLREKASLRELRNSGAFFTPRRIATALATRLGNRLAGSARICDPTCGAGDLLLAIAQRLPVAATLPETLRRWGSQLCGSDIERSFVSATRLRLALLAVSRLGHGAPHTPLRLHALLPRFETADILSTFPRLHDVTHLVVNPPFTATVAESTDWARGSVTAAALFIERCIRAASAGTRILAILPEVLRSGSRYERWRQLILSRAKVNDISIVGRFAPWADIDVFIADLTVRREPLTRPRGWAAIAGPRRLPRLGQSFDVHVGPVVPYRDPRRGTPCSYIHARSAPRWGTMRNIIEERRYRGRTFDAPFVVVRRTSRPSDQHRAVATLVPDGTGIAIENHLIIILPKDRTIKSCRRLMAVLRSPRTTRWLNQRIRCRHLTVVSLSQLPMWRIRR